MCFLSIFFNKMSYYVVLNVVNFEYSRAAYLILIFTEWDTCEVSLKRIAPLGRVYFNSTIFYYEALNSLSRLLSIQEAMVFFAFHSPLILINNNLFLQKINLTPVYKENPPRSMFTYCRGINSSCFE